MGNVLPKHLAQVCCFPHSPGVPRCSIWYTTHPLPYALVRFAPEHCSCVNSCHVNIRLWRMLAVAVRESGRGGAGQVAHPVAPKTVYSVLACAALRACSRASRTRTECYIWGGPIIRAAWRTLATIRLARRAVAVRNGWGARADCPLSVQSDQSAADGLTGGWSVLCWFASGAETARHDNKHRRQYHDGGQQHEHNG